MKKSWLRSRKPKSTTVGIHCADHATPSNRKKVGNNFADVRRSLGRYSSLADYKPRSLSPAQQRESPRLAALLLVSTAVSDLLSVAVW
jgi:hypothetical protein